MLDLEPFTPEVLADRLAKTKVYSDAQKVDAAILSAKLAHKILDDILAELKPGMLESEARELAQLHFMKHGIERNWHPPYVRCAEHTLLTFQDGSGEDKKFDESDVVFLDIGIVKDGIEGDAGRTIVFGDNAEYARVAAASKTIFDETVRFWKKHDPSGIALYEHVYSLAEKLNVKWNLDPAGHLIGAFPHKGWKRGINRFPEKIDAGKWILEIQVRHSELPIGAFYEDLLY